ncbi:hypothetical protein RBWH47_03166 [Rhodopirellula baltica WH47]|uniref:Uncharacterized protein n=1 Tax=Rhodopirellula baltica WH47 TaxID=991778 RepID=F2B1H2_RHOBT|nr:hypothetical protein RBWH47_03166 [Rhodopirellula baltica WH47]
MVGGVFGNFCTGLLRCRFIAASIHFAEQLNSQRPTIAGVQIAHRFAT